MRKSSLFITIVIIIMTQSQVDAQSDHSIIAGKDIAVAKTQSGKVRGFIHNGIYTFKGIPYGVAKRFMPAEKPAAWNDVRSCMAYGPICPNNDTPVFKDEIEFAFHRDRGYYTSEDCLNLNIWTSNIGDGPKKPVMLWLHGGGFSSGSAVEFPSYDGESLSRKDVVLVSINHRLNVLGFLDLSAYGEKYKYSANAGAMDMVLALQWIRDNISSFGGNPENVTIFGQSGGGAKVICLMNAPSAKGLFHKAIVQSGSYPNHFIDSDISKKVSAALLEELKLKADQIDSLQSISWERLDAAGKIALTKIKKTLKPEQMPAFGLEWEPVHDAGFLPYQPNEAQALDLSKNIPLMVGSVKNEYTPFEPGSGSISMEEVNNKLNKKYGPQADAYIAAVKKAYPQTVKPSDYVDIDFIFRPFVISHANQRAVAGSSVYVYLFAWQSPVLDGAFKAFHCMDLPFVFNNVQLSQEMTGGGKEAIALADKVSEAWVQFARTGNPNNKKLPAWPSYNIQQGSTMIFDATCEAKDHHDKELLVFGLKK